MLTRRDMVENAGRENNVEGIVLEGQRFAVEQQVFGCVWKTELRNIQALP